MNGPIVWAVRFVSRTWVTDCERGWALGVECELSNFGYWGLDVCVGCAALRCVALRLSGCGVIGYIHNLMFQSLDVLLCSRCSCDLCVRSS